MRDIWLIGAGVMAQDYIRVLQGLGRKFVVIGRGEESAKKCSEVTQCGVVVGGLERYLKSNPNIVSHAIVAVGAESLYHVVLQLLNYGVKNILVEKPGALYKWQFDKLCYLSKRQEASVFIAYNRRFYASVLRGKKIVEEDGGVSSFNFEFTEWSHVIETLDKPKEVKGRWFLANSTHVADLAFYFGGKPKEISCYTSGGLSWHPSASIFSGSGISESGSLFNYFANWEAPGRWSVEVLTRMHRLIFRPLEKLKIQRKGEIHSTICEDVDYSLDEVYKPGLYLQTKAFLENNYNNMCSIQEQYRMIDVYNMIANYQG